MAASLYTTQKATIITSNSCALSAATRSFGSQPGLQNSGVLSDNHAEAPKHNSQAWGSPGLPKSLDPVHPWKVSVCTEPLVQDRSNPIGTGHSPSMSRLVVSVQPFAAWGILRSTQDRSRLKADQYRKSPRISAREPFGCLRERAVR